MARCPLHPVSGLIDPKQPKTSLGHMRRPDPVDASNSGGRRVSWARAFCYLLRGQLGSLELQGPWKRFFATFSTFNCSGSALAVLMTQQPKKVCSLSTSKRTSPHRVASLNPRAHSPHANRVHGSVNMREWYEVKSRSPSKLRSELTRATAQA